MFHFSYEKTKRKRSVHDEWMEEFEWLEVEEDKMFCKACLARPELSDKKSTLVTGCTTFRKETLKFHNKSEKHRLCMSKYKKVDNPFETPIAHSFKKAEELGMALLESMFNTAYYIAVENESFLKYPELLNLLEKNGVTVTQNYRNDKYCKEFCESSAEDVVKEDRKATRFFSILSDGSTDKGIREGACICEVCR